MGRTPGRGSSRIIFRIETNWKTGDTVTLVLPKTLHVEAVPDNNRRAALMWGPLVLAGDLGPERRGGPTDSAALITGDKPLTEWLQPMPDNLGVFRTVGVGRTIDDQTNEVEFVPFYRLHRRTYSIYWDLHTKRVGPKSRRAESGTGQNSRSWKLRPSLF